MDDMIIDEFFPVTPEMPQGEIGAPKVDKPDRRVSRVLDDGRVHFISEAQIDTEEFEKGSGPTIPGFSDQDLTDQEDRIRSNQMGMSSGTGIDVSPAGAMKKDISDSIEKGYGDLSRGTKIRVLKELMKNLEEEGESRRQAAMGVRRR